MRTIAVVATGKGGPEVLELRSIDLGWPAGPGDVLVRLEAASVNPADLFFRQLGGYIDGPQPLVLGHDGAGIVEAVGAAVNGLAPGDRVAFCHGGIGGPPGTYAHHAVVPASLLVPVPEGVDLRAAAALPLVGITAAEAIEDRIGLAAGETVLVHAGAGGTGHVTIQVARLAGARVAATVRDDAKARRVLELGAELAIRADREDFVAATLAWTEGRGVDAAIDNLGGDVLRRTFAAMAPYGRVVTLMGLTPDDDSGTAYNRNLTLHALMMLTPQWLGLPDRLVRQAAHLARLMELLAAGRLTVRIALELPLAEAAEAHRRLEAGGIAGKIVLRMPVA